MATLYAENIPDELYEALRQQAKQNRKSIAAEIVELLASNVVTASELKARQQFFHRIEKLRSKRPLARGPFPSSEELLARDRER